MLHALIHMLALESLGCSNHGLHRSAAADAGRFHAGDFCQAPQVPVGLTEFGGEEGLDEIPGDGRPDGPATHAEDVEVIVLDALLGGEMVVDEGGADTGDLVGADRRADTAPADRYAALYLSGDHRLRERSDEVGIVVFSIQRRGRRYPRSRGPRHADAR